MKKHILLVYAKGNAEIFNRQSALGSYIFCLARILTTHGYRLSLNGFEFDLSLEQKNVELLHVNTGRRSLRELIPVFLKEMVRDIRLLNANRNLFSFIIGKQEHYDRILEFYTYGSDLGSELSVKLGIPLTLVYDNPVLEEHSFFHPGQLFFKKLMSRREQQSLQNASSMVVYSEPVRTFLKNQYGIENSIYIHQNVDFSRFEFIGRGNFRSPFVIGFVGSFLPWHRVDLLVSTFIKLCDIGYDIRLLLVGNGMDFEKIRQLVRASKYSSAIEFCGFADGSRLGEMKRRMHIGVMPGSNWYGAPNKIFEYGAAGMAVIAPDTPTIQYLFEDGKEVKLFKWNDEADLFLRLKEMLDDPALLSTLSLNLQQKIKEQYSPEVTYEFYSQLMEQ